jgi:hypothetical protein
MKVKMLAPDIFLVEFCIDFVCPDPPNAPLFRLRGLTCKMSGRVETF